MNVASVFPSHMVSTICFQKNGDIYKAFITISHHVKVACGYMEMRNTLFQDFLGVKERYMHWEAR